MEKMNVREDPYGAPIEDEETLKSIVFKLDEIVDWINKQGKG